MSTKTKVGLSARSAEVAALFEIDPDIPPSPIYSKYGDSLQIMDEMDCGCGPVAIEGTDSEPILFQIQGNGNIQIAVPTSNTQSVLIQIPSRWLQMMVRAKKRELFGSATR